MYARLPSATLPDLKAYWEGFESQRNNPTRADVNAAGPAFVAGQQDARSGEVSQVINVAGSYTLRSPLPPAKNTAPPPSPGPAAPGPGPFKPAPPYTGGTPRTAEEAYNLGFSRSEPTVAAAEAVASALGLSGVLATEFVRGARDRLEGRGHRSGGNAPSGSGGVFRDRDGRTWVPPPPLQGGNTGVVGPRRDIFQRRWSPPLYREVLGRLLGRPVPLDLVLKLQTTQTGNWLIDGIALGADISILGTTPGDEREGYGLSNPQGKFARQVQEAIRRGQLPPTPQAMGLDAWYGAKTMKSVRILTRRDLDSIHVSPGLFG